MHITLFFTYGTSLRTWKRTGMLNRELAIYRKYIEKGHSVALVTYGRKDRRLYAKQLGDIKICCNEFGLPHDLYAHLIPILHARTLRRTDLIKSNQTPGALTALASARIHSKPMLARCGYMHSTNTAHEKGNNSKEARQALNDENRLFTHANHIEVTTELMKKDILSRININTNKITVIPNYVNTSIFTPSRHSTDIDLIFIGRLNKEKNLFGLLDALDGLNLKTVIIGKGPLEAELKAKANELNLDIDWKGNLPNTELPDYLNRAKLFILPSFYEGHPKTLIEAMAAGIPVIGADSTGIRDILQHHDNGVLCKPEASGIRKAIIQLLESPDLCTRLGKNARAFAIKHYSLENIAERELSLLNYLITQQASC